MRRGSIAAGVVAIAAAACAPPEPGLAAVVRNADEAVLDDSGRPVPVLIGAAPRLGLCVETPAGGELRGGTLSVSVDGRPSPSGAVAPGDRLGQTVCFEVDLPAKLLEGSTLEVTAELSRDGEAPLPVACPAVQWRRRAPEREALDAALTEALRGRFEAPEDHFLARLDALAATARADGLPLLEARIRLVAAHFLSQRLDPDAFAAAEDRLASLPPWLAGWEGSRLGASLAYQRAVLGINAGGDARRTWDDLAAAERGYVRLAEERFLLPVIVQAGLLAEAGAPRPAIDRLRLGLADCERLGCADWIVAQGRDQLAWAALLDPLASDDDLAAAGAVLADAPDDEDPAARADRLLDRAYLAVTTGGDPEPDLEGAAEALGRLGTDRERARMLADFAGLVGGLGALARGDGTAALERCGALARRDGPWTAWALGCAARAHRLLGDLEAAQRELERSLSEHEHADPRAAGLGLPLGVAQRALDYSAAALVAVERGRPEEAWRLLLRLDAVSTREGERGRCRAGAEERGAGPEWRRLDAEAGGLLRRLAELTEPVSAAREAEVGAARGRVMRRLQDLWWEWPGCADGAAASDAGLDYRAFAGEGSVVLLHRRSDGTVERVRVTPWERRRLARDLEALDRAMRERRFDDGAWRRAAAPFAAALLPDRPEALGPVTSYALHGELQNVPLAALPVAGPGSTRWLGELTAPALQPTGPPVPRTERGGGGPPVFVVDPTGDLAGSTRRAEAYRRRFPKARVLLRAEATRAAFEASVRDGAWLHFDGHGVYEAGFPELSALVLADARLRWMELAERGGAGLRFANLSGCSTGSWPVTAGSGRYGFCGLLARAGTPWVVCARADLDDATAGDFNAAFYRDLGAGSPVAAAYRSALYAVSRRHPAAAWAALALLRAPAAAPGAGARETDGDRDATRRGAR